MLKKIPNNARKVHQYIAHYRYRQMLYMYKYTIIIIIKTACGHERVEPMNISIVCDI